MAVLEASVMLAMMIAFTTKRFRFVILFPARKHKMGHMMIEEAVGDFMLEGVGKPLR